MAMMISKFHRMIQNKITWWIVLVIIIFSFVIWGSQARNSNSNAQRQTAVATLQGKPIEHDEYRQAYAATHLSLILSYGRDITISPQVDTYLKKASWQRIAALHEAHSLGLDASDEEVAGMTQQLPIFRTKEGQFSMQGYQQFVSQYLPKIGFSKTGFDEFMREEITLQKAAAIVSRMLLVSPYDARRTFQALNDKFVLQYAMLTPDLVSKTVKVGRDEAKALFDKDPKAFTIPEMVQIRYVAVPFSNYTDKVTVKDDEIQKYYNDHMDEFVIPSTNVAKTGTESNEFSTEAVKYKDVAVVKPEIVKALQMIGATDLAKSNVVDFVTAVQGGLAGKPISFDEAAKKFGLEIATPPAFSEMDDVTGVKAGSDFNKIAFGLSNEEGGNIGEPVQGRDAWYVMAFKNRIPERVPNFEEVLDKVLPEARSQAISDALAALGKKTRDAMDAAAKSGQPIAPVVAASGAKLVTTTPFTASGGEDQKIENFDVLIRGALPHNAGEVTDLLPTREGLIVAYVKDRTPADAGLFESLKPRIAESVRRQQGRQLFEGWQDYLLKRDHFDDILKKATGES